MDNSLRIAVAVEAIRNNIVRVDECPNKIVPDITADTVELGRMLTADHQYTHNTLQDLTLRLV